MKLFRTFTFILSAVATFPGAARNVNFDEVFTDSTLRIDYIFSGTNRTQHIAISGLSKTTGWYGRRHQLDRLLLKGNGQLAMIDPATGDTVYRHSFLHFFRNGNLRRKPPIWRRVLRIPLLYRYPNAR